MWKVVRFIRLMHTRLFAGSREWQSSYDWGLGNDSTKNHRHSTSGPSFSRLTSPLCPQKWISIKKNSLNTCSTYWRGKKLLKFSFVEKGVSTGKKMRGPDYMCLMIFIFFYYWNSTLWKRGSRRRVPVLKTSITFLVCLILS